MKHLTRMGLVLVTGWLMAAPVSAAVISVTTLSDSLAGPACSLRAAVLAASTDAPVGGCPAGDPGLDRIQLGAGVHVLTLAGADEDAGLSGDLDVDGAVEIVGAGRTLSFVQWDGVASDRLLDVAHGASLLLADLTLRRGVVSGRGGLLRVDGTATLRDCALLEGVAAFGGGIGIGGGANLTVERCEIGNNQGDGGGIGASLRSQLLVRSSRIHDNRSASVGGGGILGSFAELIVEDTEIADNRADDSRWGGGGLLLQGGSLQLRRSTLADNSASDAQANGGVITSRFDDSGGGAISLRGARADIENSTLSGNRADETLLGGGGILAVYSDARLAHATLAGNESARNSPIAAGGSLARWDHDRPTAELRLTHSLVSASGQLCFAPGPITGLANRIDDASCGAGAGSLGPVTGLDPTLSANGGPTRTHLLMAGSNAIDAGPASCQGPDGQLLLVGQRGVARPQNGLCDLGAIEIVPAQADLSITKTDGASSAFPGGSVTYTITASNAGPDSTTATVSDPFPTAVDSAIWTCVGVGGGSCTAAGSGDINDSVNLPAGASVTYTAVAPISLAASGALVNTATVSSPSSDPNPANNSATDTDTLVPLPSLSIDDISVSEGNSGPAIAVFTVSLSDAAGPAGVSFDIATADGTASAASDYASLSLTEQRIPPGESSYSFPVTVNGDTLFEQDERFVVTLSHVVGATVADAQGQATISNDDVAPTLRITSPAQAEGNSGTSTMNFVVSLSTVSGLPVSFDRATADGTASAGSDYLALDSAVAAIPAGETSLTIPVAIMGDTVFEGDESFSLVLSAISNATPSPTLIGTGTILDDDAEPTTTTITSAQPEPSVVGQPYTVVVTVAGSSSPPTGTVSISDGSASCGPVILVAGASPESSASCDLTSTSAGTKTLSASYDPAGAAYGASNGTSSHQVSPAATTVSVSGPAQMRVNTSAGFTAALTVNAPGSGTPAGLITLSSGASMCMISVPAAMPRCDLSFSTLGPRTIRADFVPADGNFLASTSTGAGNAQTVVHVLSDLAVSKTDHILSYFPGDLLVYTVQLRNAGPDAALNLRLRDAVPAGLLDARWTCDASGGATCPAPAGAGGIDLEIPSYPRDALLNFTFFGTVDGNAASITNVAAVDLPGDGTVQDLDLSNNVASDRNVAEMLLQDGFEAPTALLRVPRGSANVDAPAGSYRVPTETLRGLLDGHARPIDTLRDATGLAATLYARLHGNRTELALATRDAQGRWQLSAWQAPRTEPLLRWTARYTSGGWVLMTATVDQ